MWSQDAVVYQIYPRSFQDSDGDGVGDLRGIAARLDHLVELGADALWLSPIYPSPLADFGYDVTDHAAIDPVYGTLADLDSLVEEAHARGLRLLMDLVPCHTSIEHPWFREHPDWYVWAEGRDGEPPNNWVAAFGGSAWSFDPGRGGYYLHSFYPEQPDLDWGNPEVVEAMQGVIRFWRGRGVDGFRLDALDRVAKDAELRDDPPATEAFPFPAPPEAARLAPVHSANAAGLGDSLGAIREAAGDDAFLVGEVYLPTASLGPYLEHLDAVFAFELVFAPWEAGALRMAIEAATALAGPRQAAGPAWVLSNHDFARLPNRVGEANVRAAALLLLTLPGTAFLYQGDEIGQPDGPGADPPRDRAGRDRHRHPMRWDRGPSGGFTTGRPWLPPLEPPERNVEDQRADPRSLLSLCRDLIELRRGLGPGLRMLDAPEGVLAYERGDHAIAVNPTDRELPAPAVGEPVLETEPGVLRGGVLAPHAAVVCR
jgi:alpha-glucosidase